MDHTNSLMSRAAPTSGLLRQPARASMTENTPLLGRGASGRVAMTASTILPSDTRLDQPAPSFAHSATPTYSTMPHLHTEATKRATSRPSMMRAATSTAAALHVTTTTAPTPLLSRPITSRSSTASAPAALRPALSRTSTTAKTSTRPSFFRRATDLLEPTPQPPTHADTHPRHPAIGPSTRTVQRYCEPGIPCTPDR